MAALTCETKRVPPLTLAEYDRDIDVAVAAERERCAKIAESHAQHLGLPTPLDTSITFRVGNEIAVRIRGA